MSDSRILSPEAQGLFDTIRAQAQEYSTAFDFLEAKRSEFESRLEEISNVSSSLIGEVHSAIDDMQKNLQDSIELLENKNDRIIKIYDDLDSIDQLKESLAKLHDTLKKQAFEVDSMLITLKLKTEVGIDATLITIKEKMSKELELEAQKLEARLAMRVKQFEHRLLSNEQKLLNLSDVHVRQLNAINEDIGLLKKSFLYNKQLAEEVQKSLDTKIDGSKEEISRRIESVRAAVGSLEKDQPYKTRGSSLGSDDLINDIQYLKRSIQGINSSVDKLAKKQSLYNKIFISVLFLLILSFIIYSIL